MSKAQDIEGWTVTKLHVRGFKSIGKQQVTAVFPRGLCCIVGPNGSGKSNLLDAICFVCGCSIATLGVQRLSELQCTDVQEVRLNAPAMSVNACPPLHSGSLLHMYIAGMRGVSRGVKPFRWENAYHPLFHDSCNWQNLQAEWKAEDRH